MKKGILITAAAALSLTVFCNQPTSEGGTKGGTASVSPQTVDKSSSEIAWIKEDYKQALAKADSDGKLLMVDVYTTWCGPCKMMDKDTFPAKDVVDKSANFVTLKLDAEKGQGPDVAKNFKVEGFPTILFIDGKGNMVHSVLGYVDATAMVAEMDKALDKAS